MYINLAELVTDAIHHVGREDVFKDNNNIDNHSTITINLDELPDINIFTMDDIPIIWSVIEQYNEINIHENSEKILEYLMNNDNSYFYFGQPALLKINNKLEFRATFAPSALKDGESMAAAIDVFVSFMDKMIKLYI